MSKHGQRGEGILDFLKEVVIVVVGALIASTLIRLFLVQVFAIPSRSMVDTLEIGDRVAVQKVAGFERGDVVVFRDDLEWLGNPDRYRRPAWQDALVFLGLMPDESSNHLVKRVIGMPGDRVVCCDSDGRLEINGVALDEGAYLHADPSGRPEAPSEYPFDVVVPAGRIFVMGDHRSNSADSRCHLDEQYNGVAGINAFPRVESVVGTTVATLFPFDRWRTFATPAVFGSVPDALGAPPDRPMITGATPHC